MAANLAVGRLQAALASATNEVTVAAANINFDFALVKCEAPPEYQPISRDLTSHRRAEAEGGSQHITARRLGALFEDLCPHTPNLISAFGKRASEISTEGSAKSQHTASNWIFSDYIGVDSAALWAAATSSKAALPVYLLACMLARAWSDADATSIWTEIVAERRRDIAVRFEQNEEIRFASVAAASQQEITREQLAKWDASARAWLRTADNVKMRQRKQFLLIANNISIPVNSERRPYESILSAWVSALETMERIISGEPHAVGMSGSVLVAIQAWHIYPNMLVFSGKEGSKVIDMGDPLVRAGGVVSLGLSGTNDTLESSRGVYWSLSLAHHKFYGRPVQKSSSSGMNIDDSRLTFAELQMAVLGVILERWQTPLSETTNCLKSLLQILSSLLPLDNIPTPDKWISMITAPILQYFQDKNAAAPLLALGRRRTRFIPLGEDGLDHPYFGITQITTMLTILRTADNQIAFLRRLAGRVEGLEDADPYIAFYSDGEWYLVAVFPQMTGGNRDMVGHRSSRTTGLWKGIRKHCIWTPRPDAPRHSSSQRVLPHSRVRFDGPQASISLHNGEKRYEFLLGDMDSAAIFVPTARTYRKPSSLPDVTLEDLVWALQHDLIQPVDMYHKLLLFQGPIREALTCLATVSDVYISLSKEGASISPKILEHEFFSSMYRRSTQPTPFRRAAQQGFLRARPHTLGILKVIAAFELGRPLNLDGIGFTPVLGISVGNSIYVAKSLLNDPINTYEPEEFCRILGNLGRPGLTVITTPTSPLVRDIDSGLWRKTPAIFDGAREDCFRSTSLHLSFTEWSTPLYTANAVGQRDTEAHHVEAAVSVRDSGAWVADISPLTSATHPDVDRLPPPPESCRHPRPSTPPVMVSLETWHDILDCPAGAVVTRSSKNWVARLAIVWVLAHHCKLENKRIYICPDNTCWQCLDPLKEAIYVY